MPSGMTTSSPEFAFCRTVDTVARLSSIFQVIGTWASNALTFIRILPFRHRPGGESPLNFTHHIENHPADLRSRRQVSSRRMCRSADRHHVMLQKFQWSLGPYSALSVSAVDVLAAIRPGMVATSFAKISVPMTTKITETVGTVGSGTALMLRAN